MRTFCSHKLFAYFFLVGNILFTPFIFLKLIYIHLPIHPNTLTRLISKNFYALKVPDKFLHNTYIYIIKENTLFVLDNINNKTTFL